ncbi:hypothetical protein DTO002I6_9976 [Penicillium roqueforti]|nr:hypothetical protein DTO002I6_9976 [Penicillium roqueforti]
MADPGNGTGPVQTANQPLVGVGAPKNKDWDEVEDASYSTGDQSEGLPAVGSFVLYKMEPLLKEKEDFDNWLGMVTKILESHGLHRLIDKNIERPDRDAANAETWMKLSMQVSTWLRLCIDPDVAKYITSSGKRTKWADDFMHECKLHMRGEGHGALSAAIIRFIGTKRTDFSTTIEFIDALKQRFKTANDLKAAIPPYQAIVIMVNQLQEITELRSSIEIKNNELKSIKNPAAEMTIQDFFLYCSEMQDKVKEFNIDGGVSASATKAPKGQQNNRQVSSEKTKLTNAPPYGKHARKHVEEWRNHKTQRTANGNCSYCGGQGHDAKDCFYLVADERPQNWKPKPGLWYWKTSSQFHENKSQQVSGKPTDRTRQANFDAVATSATANEGNYDFGGMAIAQDKEGFSGTATVNEPTRLLRNGVDWILDSGSSWHICSNRELFVTFEMYKPGTAIGWDSSAGQQAVAEGHGDIILPIRKPNGTRYELRVHCVYKPGNKFNLLSLMKIRQDQGIRWNPDDMVIKDSNQQAIGYTFIAKNVPIIELADEPYPVHHKEGEGLAYVLISAELAHRRLGHAGSYKGRVNKDKLGCDIGTEHFDCESCGKGKSKKIISRDQQARATKVGQLLHVDLHPVKPKGIGKDNKIDKEYAMIITDDASRFRVALCISKKSDASSTLKTWTEQFKRHAGYYPTEWRYDNGKEFFHFTTWAKTVSMTVSTSTPYAHEQNGVSEYSGHYIMQIARTMHIDAGIAPMELWTEAVTTAAYVINRLTRSGGEAPILAWRKAMNLRGDQEVTNLSFLRVWYSKAYVHKPKETRTQGMKMDPRAWIGYLVGYEGDNGHCYRIYDPKTKKVSTHRDVVFWEMRIPRTYDGTNEIKIGEEIIDGPPVKKTQFTIGEPLFENTRAATEALSKNFQNLHLRTIVEHASPGEEHQQDSETNSVNTEDAELFYNIDEEVLQEESLEDRVQALTRRVPETPARSTQQISPPQSRIIHEEPVTYPPLPGTFEEPNSPSPTPTPSRQPEMRQVNTNPARLDPPQPLRRSERSTKGHLPEYYDNIKWGKYGARDQSGEGGSQCAVNGDEETGLVPEDYWMNSPFGVGFALSSTEKGPEQGTVTLPPMGQQLKSWNVKIPRTYTEAMASKQKDQWYAAMETQIEKLKAAKTYEIVKQPPAGATILPGKWVFDLKIDKENVVQEFRARWVVCGNRQRPGIDFDENYAPVARGETMRLFLSMVVVNNMFLEQVDYTAAYLNAIIDNRIVFMRQPAGFEKNNPNQEKEVCLLLQAMYGLRQAGYLWYGTIAEALKKMGFKPLVDEPCIMVHEELNIWILLYVDDTLIASLNEEGIKWFKDKIPFKYRDLGKPDRFLGSSLSRGELGIFLNQRAYAEEIIMKAGLQSAAQVYLPMKTTYKSPDITNSKEDKDVRKMENDLEEDQPQVTKEEAKRFIEDIGKLGWLTDKSRPDIALAVNKLQRRASAPREEDVDALKQLNRYVKGTMDLGILLGKDPSTGLIGYVDASYHDCEDGKSTEAFIFYYAGGPISWSSKKEEIVARSSTAAEYIAFDAAIRECMWLLKIMDQMGKRQKLPITIYSDSDNAVSIMKKDNYSKGTKWVDARYHFVRHAVREGIIKLELIASAQNIADALTKPLARELFEPMRKRMMAKTPNKET